MRIPRKMALTAICLALLSILLPSCSNNQSPIVQAVTASKVDEAGKPELIADTFTPDVDTIYCAIQLAHTNINSNVKGEWYIVKSDEAELTNTIIAEGKVEAGATDVVLAFSRSEKLLPRGDYVIKLYYDEQYIRSVPFKIVGEVASSQATLSEATLCTSIDLLTNKPIDKVNVFPSDIPGILCSVKVNNAGFNTNIKAKWVYLDGELQSMKGKTIYEPVVRAEGREYIYFSISVAPGKKMMLGEYQVTLFVEEQEQVTLPFSVVEASSIKWPYISDLIVFSVDVSDNKTFLFTPFPTGTKQVNLNPRIYNAPEGTRLSVQLWLVRSADAFHFDQKLNEYETIVQGTEPIIAIFAATSEPFVAGEYAVKLLVNGQEYAVIPFIVR